MNVRLQFVNTYTETSTVTYTYKHTGWETLIEISMHAGRHSCNHT